MRVTDTIEEVARLGRRLAAIDEELRNENTNDLDRRELEAERRAVVQILALKNAIEE